MNVSILTSAWEVSRKRERRDRLPAVSILTSAWEVSMIRAEEGRSKKCFNSHLCVGGVASAWD